MMETSLMPKSVAAQVPDRRCWWHRQQRDVRVLPARPSHLHELVVGVVRLAVMGLIKDQQPDVRHLHTGTGTPDEAAGSSEVAPVHCIGWSAVATIMCSAVPPQ